MLGARRLELGGLLAKRFDPSIHPLDELLRMHVFSFFPDVAVETALCYVESELPSKLGDLSEPPSLHIVNKSANLVPVRDVRTCLNTSQRLPYIRVQIRKCFQRERRLQASIIQNLLFQVGIREK